MIGTRLKSVSEVKKKKKRMKKNFVKLKSVKDAHEFSMCNAAHTQGARYF